MQLFRDCSHMLKITQGKKFEDMFLVKIADKGTLLINWQLRCLEHHLSWCSPQGSGLGLAECHRNDRRAISFVPSNLWANIRKHKKTAYGF